MTARRPAALGGLAVASLHGDGHAWHVVHAASGMPAHDGYLRQRRFAEQACTDLLATGVDFTGTPQEIFRQRDRWRAAYALWSRRARQDRIDLVTGEHYSRLTHYGQVIPSAAHARELASALASYLWS